MEVRELMKQFIDERVQELLSEGMEGFSNRTEPYTDVIESVMKNSPLELQSEIEALISQFIERRAEEERLLYMSGLRDGAYICRVLFA